MRTAILVGALIALLSFGQDGVSLRTFTLSNGLVISEKSRLTIPANYELQEDHDIHADEVIVEGRVITNGYRFTINSNLLVFKPAAEIIAFDENSAAATGPGQLPAATGKEGDSGERNYALRNYYRDRGALVLKPVIAELRVQVSGKKGRIGATGSGGATGADGRGNEGTIPLGAIEVLTQGIDGDVRVLGYGQNGGRGGQGQPGGQGGPGGPGLQANADTYDWWPAGNGGEGGDGGTGGTGGSGGKGGPGVPVSLFVLETKTVASNVTAREAPGLKGRSGPGGNGGLPGVPGTPGGAHSIDAPFYHPREDGGGPGKPGNPGLYGYSPTDKPQSRPFSLGKVVELPEFSRALRDTRMAWVRFHFARWLLASVLDSARMLQEKSSNAELLSQVWERDLVQLLTEYSAREGSEVIGSTNTSVQRVSEYANELTKLFKEQQSVDGLTAEIRDWATSELRISVGACKTLAIAREKFQGELAQIQKLSHRLAVPVCDSPDRYAQPDHLLDPIQISAQSPPPLIAPALMRFLEIVDPVSGEARKRAMIGCFSCAFAQEAEWRIARGMTPQPIIEKAMAALKEGGQAVEPHGLIVPLEKVPSAGSLAKMLRSLALSLVLEGQK